MNHIQRLKKLWSYFLDSELATNILGGFSAVAVAKIGGLGLSFFAHVVLARVTTVEDYGTYIYVWGWIVVFAYVSRVGFDNVVERYVSKFRAEERWRELRAVLCRAIQYSGGFGVSISVLGGTTVWLLSSQISVSMQTTFWYGFILLPILTCLYIVQSGLRGLQRVGQAFIPELFVRNIILIVVCSLVWFILGALDASRVMKVTLISFIIAFGAGVVLLWKALPQQSKHVKTNYGEENWLAKALPFMVFAGTSLLQRKADVLMLGVLAAPRDVGIYGVALRLTNLIVLPLVIANQTMRPYFSEMYTSGEKSDLQWLFSLCIIVVTPITLVLGGGLIIFGPELLSIFGGEYTLGYGLMILLVAGQMIAAMTGPVGVFMIMTDQEKVASRIEGIAAVANICLNGALIPYFGAEGAALATATTLAGRNISFAYIVLVQYDINPTIFNENILNIIYDVPN